VTPGASLVRHLTSPLLEPCWSDDIFDWDLVDYVYDDLSRGEKAFVALAQSLDGQGNCNIGVCLGDIDGTLRDLFVMQLAKHVDRLVR
jgi:hypothetical protein